VVGLSQLQIVDGAGDGSVEGVTLKTFDPPLTGGQNLSGSFDASQVNPAVAGSLNELAGHVCMGHIYAAAKMESGQILMGKLVYVPEQGSTLACDEAVPGEHGGATDDHSTTPPASTALISSAISRSAVAVVIVAALFVF
jgi:hypothetical protein